MHYTESLFDAAGINLVRTKGGMLVARRDAPTRLALHGSVGGVVRHEPANSLSLIPLQYLQIIAKWTQNEANKRCSFGSSRRWCLVWGCVRIASVWVEEDTKLVGEWGKVEEDPENRWMKLNGCWNFDPNFDFNSSVRLDFWVPKIPRIESWEI